MATNILTQARLKELLRYDPATGVFTNAQKRGRCHRAVPNSPAGYARKDKYLIIQLAAKKYYAHHLIHLKILVFLLKLIVSFTNSILS